MPPAGSLACIPLLPESALQPAINYPCPHTIASGTFAATAPDTFGWLRNWVASTVSIQRLPNGRTTPCPVCLTCPRYSIWKPSAKTYGLSRRVPSSDIIRKSVPGILTAHKTSMSPYMLSATTHRVQDIKNCYTPEATEDSSPYVPTNRNQK